MEYMKKKELWDKQKNSIMDFQVDDLIGLNIFDPPCPTTTTCTTTTTPARYSNL